MNSSGQALLLGSATPQKQKQSYTVMFEGTALEPMHMVIDGPPPPSAPPTPTPHRAADTRPMLPLRIHLKTPSRRHADDEEDVFAAAGLGGAVARCEACGAAFASSNRRAFWKHVTLNVCRKRQDLRGRGRLGMWWTGRGRL